jgi:hypothetical protein
VLAGRVHSVVYLMPSPMQHKVTRLLAVLYVMRVVLLLRRHAGPYLHAEIQEFTSVRWTHEPGLNYTYAKKVANKPNTIPLILIKCEVSNLAALGRLRLFQAKLIYEIIHHLNYLVYIRVWQ